MLAKLSQMEKEALAAVADTTEITALADVRVAYLGKKGHITQISRNMADIPAAQRPQMGQAINKVKEAVEQAIEERTVLLQASALSARLTEEKIDITLPGDIFAKGSRHILDTVIMDIEEIFLGMGYTIAEGPQVETDYYNFEALNIPPDHPARDMQDSFYFSDNLLLRTQTSSMQVRTMEKMRPQLPVKIICPGAVYRRDDDATHSPMFHQVEGLYIDKKVSLADLKGTLLYFARQMFGEEREIRLRPSYFPFTEPSAEVDISCFVCGGKGCRLCKGSGWIEILGSGVVHPHVLEMSGYDPEQCTGFAFGLGVERIAMLKYGINDIRLLFENDMRFLKQF